jgi:hypothetical protein
MFALGRVAGSTLARRGVRTFADDATKITLNFAVPHRVLYENAQVELVRLTSCAGEYGVTAGHTPNVSQLAPGVALVYKSKDAEPEKYFVSGASLFWRSCSGGVGGPGAAVSTFLRSLVVAAAVSHVLPPLLRLATKLMTCGESACKRGSGTLKLVLGGWFHGLLQGVVSQHSLTRCACLDYTPPRLAHRRVCVHARQLHFGRCRR